MPLKSIYNKNLGSIEQKCIFEHYKEVQTRKTLLIDIIFVMIKLLMTFSEQAPIGLCQYYTKMHCSIVVTPPKWSKESTDFGYCQLLLAFASEDNTLNNANANEALRPRLEKKVMNESEPV
jgi:hypothetical protein